MDLTENEIAKWKSNDFDFAFFANMMFIASIALHLANLNASSLVALADVGALLVDETKILSRDFSYDAVYVLSRLEDISEQDKRQWNFLRFTPLCMFGGLKEFVLIQRHMLRLPQDGRIWRDLTHAERLHATIAYVGMLAPLEIYTRQIQQRSCNNADRNPNQARSSRNSRGSAH